MIVELSAMSLLVGLSLASAASASGLPGVTVAETNSSAGVQPAGQSPTSGQVVTEVRRALAQSNGVNVSRIHVSADAGTVTLLGSVPDQPQIDLARQLAAGIGGVNNVVDHLYLRVSGTGS